MRVPRRSVGVGRGLKKERPLAGPKVQELRGLHLELLPTKRFQHEHCEHRACQPRDKLRDPKGGISCLQSQSPWGAHHAWGRPPSFESFTCPNCQALYHIVKVEAGPETNDREITCLACGGPLAGYDGKFVLKYFLLRKAARTRRSKEPPQRSAW